MWVTLFGTAFMISHTSRVQDPHGHEGLVAGIVGYLDNRHSPVAGQLTRQSID
jgi:hypothetical protein